MSYIILEKWVISNHGDLNDICRAQFSLKYISNKVTAYYVHIII